MRIGTLITLLAALALAAPASADDRRHRGHKGRCAGVDEIRMTLKAGQELRLLDVARRCRVKLCVTAGTTALEVGYWQRNLPDAAQQTFVLNRGVDEDQVCTVFDAVRIEVKSTAERLQLGFEIIQ